MEKIRYEIDPHNRLVVGGVDKETGLPQHRRVLDGRFKAEKDGLLTYHVKAPLPEGTDTPHQVKLRGRWSLTENHDLMLTLDKWRRQTFGDQLSLQGEIIDARENSLLFAVTTRQKDNVQSTYILELGGTWCADENNRLTFRVQKESGIYDILTFDAAWEINKNHQIIYRYEKAGFIRKQEEIHTLTFKGYWDIKDKSRLSYVLEKGTDSTFDFKSSVGIFKYNYIKYEIGIGLAKKQRPVRRVVTLFGTWKIKKDVGLIFEIESADRKARAITFGIDARLTDKDTILFKLKNDLGNKDMGIDLELSHKILKGDGELFLRFLKQKQRMAVQSGAAWRW